MEIVPNKNVFRQTFYELCPGFEKKEELKNDGKVVCRCLWCKHAEYHGGWDAVDKIGGCICLKGHDVRKVGENPVKLWEQKTGQQSLNAKEMM